jgi:hypothetical protein
LSRSERQTSLREKRLIELWWMRRWRSAKIGHKFGLRNPSLLLFWRIWELMTAVEFLSTHRNDY